jgi:type I restriction enzyme R subunit
MIGRGTRLCPDLFGPGQDKDHFLIFDFCQNFEFFKVNPDGVKGHLVKTLTQRVFEDKLEVAMLIREKSDSSDNERELAANYIDELHQQVATLDRDRFAVKAKLRAVVEFSNKDRWQNLSKSDLLDINTQVSGLVLPPKSDDELARRFDLLMLNFQLAMLSGITATEGFVNKINGLVTDLLKKLNIPAVAAQADLLNELQTEPFWRAVNINRLDDVRTALRALMKYIDKLSQENVITTFSDTLDEAGITEHGMMPTYGNLKSYKDRVESYVRQHSDHLVIQKLKTNKPITAVELEALETILFDADNVGSKEDYLQTYGEQPLGAFVRSIVGLDANAAQAVFADFIREGNLRADQMTFMNTIISFLTKNGVIAKDMLFESPFTDVHDQGLLGVFDDAAAMNVIRLIDRINLNVEPFDSSFRVG